MHGSTRLSGSDASPPPTDNCQKPLHPDNISYTKLIKIAEMIMGDYEKSNRSAP